MVNNVEIYSGVSYYSYRIYGRVVELTTSENVMTKGLRI